MPKRSASHVRTPPSGCTRPPARARQRRTTALDARYRLRPGQLLIVDEASLAGTLTLDTLTRQTQAAGAKLLLVGDHRQLSSVDAGGAFGLLATETRAVELTSLWRLTNAWEATAGQQLRVGERRLHRRYAAHGRLHDGPAEAMTADAYDAWETASRNGRSASTHRRGQRHRRRTQRPSPHCSGTRRRRRTRRHPLARQHRRGRRGHDRHPAQPARPAHQHRGVGSKRRPLDSHRPLIRRDADRAQEGRRRARSEQVGGAAAGRLRRRAR